jgi:hypothetical protein
MRLRFIYFLLLVPALALSQRGLLPSLIESAPHANPELIQARMADFILAQKEKMKLAKNEVRFLKSMVNESHRKFLKSYKSYSQFNELFENGLYDCLSGTAFFSVVLEELQFSYKIIETNYHIFLLIETSQGKVLLETTDRLFGFKTNPKEIEKCVSQYQENLLASAASRKLHYYHYQANLFREVNALQLSGLLYFNQAVIAYNSHEWVTCVDRLEKARSVYNNPRVEELTEILANSIVSSKLNEKAKQPLLIHLAKYVKGLPELAVLIR